MEGAYHHPLDSGRGADTKREREGARGLMSTPRELLALGGTAASLLEDPTVAGIRKAEATQAARDRIAPGIGAPIVGSTVAPMPESAT